MARRAFVLGDGSGALPQLCYESRGQRAPGPLRLEDPLGRGTAIDLNFVEAKANGVFFLARGALLVVRVGSAELSGGSGHGK